jgi:hypothetical protein
MKLFFNLLLLISCFVGSAQPITGVWRGKIINGSGMFATTGKVELKLIKKGDSLVGTCYYFNNANTYMRYSVKGYFDSVNNAVHWTDDKFLAVKPVGKTTVGVFRDPMVSEADFNCPGNNVMKLDGKSHIGEDGPVFTLHFDKVEKPIFHDEWDNVIEGYFTGMSDPSIIDSVYAITKPFEPNVPEDVAKKVNPVIPGQQTVTGNATVVPAGTAQNSKTTGAGEKVAEGTATTAAIVTATQASKANEGPVISTSDDNGKKTADTNQPSTGLPVAGTSPNPALPRDSSGTVAANSKPASPGTQPLNEPAKTTPVAPALTGSGKAGVTTVAVTNPPATPGTNTAAGNSKPPVTGATESKSSSAKTIAATATITKPPVPGPNPASAPPQESVARQSTPANSNAVKPPVTAVPVVKNDLPVVATATPAIIKSDPLAEKMFVTRKKINQAEIPVVGDSIELNFYDNAEIDGDSISLFLNGRLLFNHVLLSAQAYTFKIPAADLPEGSELTMVAENLGTIPPNTAFMMAIVNGERYSARIESTEQSSGVIKLVKRKKQ